MSIGDHIRQPEYTGENRCTPCTAVNLVIAVVMGALVGIVSTLTGVGVFVLSVGAIYFRGYLVPGTPTLTKQYLPERVLRWFDKELAPTFEGEDNKIEVSAEEVLLNVGAVEPCDEDEDLCITDGFQKAWRDQVISVRRDDLGENRLENALTIRSGRGGASLEKVGDGIVAYLDEMMIAQWSSNAAVIADVAAASKLDERLPRRADLNPAEMARVLMSLRIFIERCPECDGVVSVDQEIVESCCRSYDVIASTCQNCGARLFEMEWSEESNDETSAVAA